MIPLPIAPRAAAALAMAAVVGGLTIWGLYWRGEAREARAERDVYVAQAKVLAESTRACSAGVEAAEKAGKAAIASGAKLLAEARRIGQPARAEAERIGRLLEQRLPPDYGCDRAWADIEAKP